MPGENLTRNEARERARLLDVDSYDISLDLTVGDETFRSDTTVRFTAEVGSSTFIDLIAPSVQSITLNGETVEVDAFDGARIALDGLAAENELRVVANAAYMNTGEGLHRFVDPVDKAVYLYTQFEVIDARRMFACFDQPDLKATFAFTVTAPDDWEVVSNSPTPAARTGHGRFAHAGPSPRRRGCRPTSPRSLPAPTTSCAMSTAESRWESSAVARWPSTSTPEPLFDVTKRGFDYFEELFAVPYPFEKYDQLFVPEFNAGAMENAGPSPSSRTTSSARR